MNQYLDEEGKQEYQYSYPTVFPDGSEITVYSTPENRRMLIKHSSGSHIEFKNDGTVVVKAVKDLHINSSVNSATVGSGNQEATSTNIVCESDLNLNVTGKLSIKCKQLDLNPTDTGRVNTSGEFVINSNNTVVKAKEQISLEGTKSVYTHTGELREKIVTRTSEIGTKEGPSNSAPTGGQENVKVQGHYVLENTDPKGGITIKSAGYMNIVTAAERIDVTGDPAAIAPQYDPTPMGRATYTHIIRPYPGPTPLGIPGSAWFEVGPGGYTQKIVGPTFRTQVGPSIHNYIGPFNETYSAVKNKIVAGMEKATIAGVYKVTAATIFLN